MAEWVLGMIFDLRIKKQIRVYNEISTELYNTINRSIICAINYDRKEKASGQQRV